MEPDVNGDLEIRASEDTAAMPWTPSPSGSVWRKRVHRVGPVESGQVTSVVRYQPGSTFPPHDHPEGEEILVLDGVFSDEQGDWTAGTYLLNPEGFRHAPRSEPGCLLLVKLRQYGGEGRAHIAVQTDEIEWQPTSEDGVSARPLYQQDGFPETMWLERWEPGAHVEDAAHPGGVEIFVIGGELRDEQGIYPEGTWLRLPCGATHSPRSATGCTLYVKRGGVGELLPGEGTAAGA